jgi:hypothetical protein
MLGITQHQQPEQSFVEEVDFILTTYLTQFGRLPGNFQTWEQWQTLSTQWYTV